ncbi:GIY-YIG nuclease family protein [Microseira wollei]|uniref:Bacteriophage T5 Orf172 DNA-binding domain-containing protein n=1 Tax=Microseira wollei NIES-4236 TaxID=2530354 RepID=A0AAV3WZU5_9CYAN|nr:GIY-YIG nuclease family protein [Microseira wollei]GET35912.1 hypothetical protein MiSe_06600 [Microseira wollei NIES-4236]
MSRNRKISQTKSPNSYVYLIHEVGTNYYKIGITVNLNKRISQLQTGSANQLKYLHYIQISNRKEVEKALHTKYKTRRVRRNGEWFEFSNQEVKSVIGTMNAYKPKLTKTETELPQWVAIAAALIISLFLVAVFNHHQQWQPQQPNPVVPSW